MAGFISEKTRVIFLAPRCVSVSAPREEFTIYNFNLGLYGVCRIVFEVAAAGDWTQTFEVDVLVQRNLQPLGSGTTEDWLFLILEAGDVEGSPRKSRMFHVFPIFSWFFLEFEAFRGRKRVAEHRKAAFRSRVCMKSEAALLLFVIRYVLEEASEFVGFESKGKGLMRLSIKRLGA